MKKETFYPTYVDYTLSGKHPLVRIFGRNNLKERTTKYLSGVLPYFYVNSKHNIPSDPSIVSTQTNFKTIENFPATKIIANKPSDIGGRKEDIQYLRDSYPETYEADILFEDRVRIDFDLTAPIITPSSSFITAPQITPSSEKIEHRYFIIDVENHDNKTIEEAIAGKSSVVSIVVFDSYTKTYYVFTYLPLSDLDKKQISFKLIEYWKNHPTLSYMKDSKIEYVCHNTEEPVMFMELIKMFKMYTPDTIAGWNFDTYDTPVIVNRMKELKLPYQDLSEVSEVRYTHSSYDIKGINVTDIMTFYTFLQQSKVKFSKLGYVAEKELGTSKLPRTSIMEMVQTDIPHLIAYNIIDVQLTELINKKDNLINFFTELSSLSHCKIGETNRSQFIDKLILHFVKNKFVLPTKKYSAMQKNKNIKGKKKKGIGGAVQNATAGLHKNIIVLDFAGLYPSIMRSLNISIETRSDTGEYVAANGIRFAAKPIGVVPQILKSLSEKRTYYKKRMYEATTPEEKHEFDLKQYAIKVLQNSFFGVMGWAGFRLSNKDTANAITTTGQFLSFNTIDFVKSLGYKVIYGDTDSLFIQAPEHFNCKQLKALSTELCQKINNNLSMVAEKEFNVKEHYFNIESDKEFKVLFQVSKKSGTGQGAKKRYAGYIYNDDGSTKFVAKGFEMLKADRAIITQDTQKELLNMILSETPKKEIHLFLNNLKNDFMSGKIPSSQIGQRYAVNLDANSPGLRGTLNANSIQILNKNHTYGDELLFFRMSGTPANVPYITELCFEYDEEIPSDYTLDYKLSWEKLIKEPLTSILEANGTPWSFISTGKLRISAFTFKENKTPSAKSPPKTKEEPKKIKTFMGFTR